MTCAKCNHGFCWRCLKSWKPNHKDYYNCSAMVRGQGWGRGREAQGQSGWHAGQSGLCVLSSWTAVGTEAQWEDRSHLGLQVLGVLSWEVRASSEALGQNRAEAGPHIRARHRCLVGGFGPVSLPTPRHPLLQKGTVM